MNIRTRSGFKIRAVLPRVREERGMETAFSSCRHSSMLGPLAMVPRMMTLGSGHSRELVTIFPLRRRLASHDDAVLPE